MPYNNQYNLGVASQARGFSQKHINRENAINDFSTSYEIPSQLEASVLKAPAVHGGSGFAAATAYDLGFEPTLGATSGEGKARRAKKKVIEIGEGLSAAGVSAGGVSGGSWSKGQNMFYEVLKGFAGGAEGAGVSGGALLSLKDIDAMHGQPEPTRRANVAVKAEGGRQVGSGARGKRNEIVREVMKKHGLSLPAASKYVKEHNLY